VGGEPPWREPWSMGAGPAGWRRWRRFSGGRRARALGGVGYVWVARSVRSVKGNASPFTRFFCE
jgi:hypothetical protein